MRKGLFEEGLFEGVGLFRAAKNITRANVLDLFNAGQLIKKADTWDIPFAVESISQPLGAYSRVWAYLTKNPLGWGLFEGGGG